MKNRQKELTAKYATIIEVTRTARANRLNGTHRPRHFLSGLLECGACGGPYAMRGQDRYGCSNHVMNGSCSNGRGIRRTELEERFLVGLKDHLMAHEAADAAVQGLRSFSLSASCLRHPHPSRAVRTLRPHRANHMYDHRSVSV